MSGTDFEGKIICGVPDNVGSVDCLWPFRDVDVYAEGAIGPLFLADAVEWAIAQWNAVCGIRLKMSANRKTAHILCKPGHLDGPSNVLAQCELPCGFSSHSWRQINMTCDLSEALVLADNPPPNKIDAGRMVCYELGHGLGVPSLGALEDAAELERGFPVGRGLAQERVDTGLDAAEGARGAEGWHGH